MSEYLEDEDLYVILSDINRIHGSLSISILKAAHKADPNNVPSYKTFERRLGGINGIDWKKVNIL